MEKDLKYYAKLPYKIEVIPIPESYGGGYTARLPEIGQFAITGDGETPEEAIKNLEQSKLQRFSEYLEQGLKIPEPDPEKEEYSGRFIIRIPKILHRQLSESAKRQQVSLNHYVTYLLSVNSAWDENKRYFSEIRDSVKCMSEAIWDVGYSFMKIKDSLYYEYEKELENELEKENTKVIQLELYKAA